MKQIKIIVIIFTLLLLSCDELIELDDPYIKIKKIIPNPANIGDTVTILLENYNHPLHVASIDQVKVILFSESNSNIDTFHATGFYDDLKKQEYGDLYHTLLIDSLSENYQQVVQCMVDSSFPSQSTVGVKLNEVTTISSSNIILSIKK